MDKIKKAAENYRKMLDVEYNFTLARKGKKSNIKLIFEKSDFKHLAGIGKLIDVPVHSMGAERIFNNTRNGFLKDSDLQKSKYYNEISDRIDILVDIEKYLDSNMIVFQWDKGKGYAKYSKIKADYGLKERTGVNERVYIFIKQTKDAKLMKIADFITDNPISIFRDARELDSGQITYTLLYSEKINKRTQEKKVLYDYSRMEKQEKKLSVLKKLDQYKQKAADQECELHESKQIEEKVRYNEER